MLIDLKESIYFDQNRNRVSSLHWQSSMIVNVVFFSSVLKYKCKQTKFQTTLLRKQIALTEYLETNELVHMSNYITSNI